MSKGIILEIPKDIYVSYDSSRTVENEFYFTVYKEYIFSEKILNKPETSILCSPTIYIKGFERLLKIKQDTPERQEAQITSAAKKFIESLVFSDMVNTKASSWAVNYTYDRDKENLTIILIYAEDELSQDFNIKISCGNFVCNTADTQNAVVFTIHTEGFEALFLETEHYEDYHLSSNVKYAPCITKFNALYDKMEYSESFFMNPDYNNKTVLSWDIAGNGKIEHFLQRDNEYIKAACSVDSIEQTVEKSVIYTLMADNQKGFSDTAQIKIKTTKWRNMGAVTGLFNNESDFNYNKNSMRIFFYKGCYYCYIKKYLYKSENGCIWTLFSENDKLLGNEDFDCTVCDLYNNILYIMAGNVGKRLKIILYDFLKNEWKYSSAYQNCISYDGSLGLSEQMYYYAQTTTYGMRVSGHDSNGDWEHWNRENFVIDTDNDKAICGDLCFWKDMFYAAVLCENNRFYLYKCDYDFKDAVFNYKTEKNNKIFLLPTTNKLFVVLKGLLFDTSAQCAADDFFPPDETIPWLGSDKDKIFGIFSDKNFWKYVL